MTHVFVTALSEANSSVSVWQAWGASIITAVTALAGVALTQRATQRREIDMRLWEKRCEAYVGVLRWSDSLYHRLINASGIQIDFAQLDPEEVLELAPPKEVEIPFVAFASREARPHFVACQNFLILLSEASTEERPGDWSEYHCLVAELQVHLPTLDSALQNELAVGGMPRRPWRRRIDAAEMPEPPAHLGRKIVQRTRSRRRSRIR